MAKKRAKAGTKKPIEQYEHTKEQRANNPEVGLVRPENDPDGAKKQYAYDPHLDPQLVWAGKAEHTSFEVPTVSLHVHERIDPKTILAAVRKANGGEPKPEAQPGRCSRARPRTLRTEKRSTSTSTRTAGAIDSSPATHSW